LTLNAVALTSFLRLHLGTRWALPGDRSTVQLVDIRLSRPHWIPRFAGPLRCPHQAAVFRPLLRSVRRADNTTSGA